LNNFMMSSEDGSTGSASPLEESAVTEEANEDPTELKGRWERLEWKSLLRLISESKAAPNAAGRLDLRYAPWDDIDLSKGQLRWTDLRNASLLRARFNGADLCGLDLRSARANEAIFKGADLCAANFGRACLSSADFSFSDLSFAKFHDAVLTGVKMTGADLSGVDFSGADLKEADMAGALYDSETKWPANFDHEAQDMILED
jgi:uncharacterized protein YjbI with pentapeptide repeats